jgi:ActR/RegA family two-component response regulator
MKHTVTNGDWNNPSALPLQASGLSTEAVAIVGERSIDRCRGRALLISADAADARSLGWAMRALNLESTWTHLGLEGLDLARRNTFSVVIVDLGLTDIPGVRVVQMLRDESETIPLVAVCTLSAGLMDIADVVARVGGLLQTPLNPTDAILTIGRVLRREEKKHVASLAGHEGSATTRGGLAHMDSAPRSIAERWAYFVLRAIGATADPKTVTNWAKAVGASRTVLCESCRLLHLPAHDARDFSRLIRAICRSGDQWQPEAVLDVADGRTLKKLLAGTGLLGRGIPTPTVWEFLERQRWIAKSNPGLVALERLLVTTAGPRDVSRAGVLLTSGADAPGPY